MIAARFYFPHINRYYIPPFSDINFYNKKLTANFYMNTTQLDTYRYLSGSKN